MKVKFVLNSDKDLLYSRGIHLNYNDTYVVYGLDIKVVLILIISL